MSENENEPRAGKHAKGMRGKDTKNPNVVYHLREDALEPRPAPWGHIIRNPVQFSLAPREARRINLLVHADVPLLAWPTRPHSDDTRVEGPMVISPGNEVTVIVTNQSQHLAMTVDSGEGLVCVHPIFYAGTHSSD